MISNAVSLSLPQKLATWGIQTHGRRMSASSMLAKCYPVVDYDGEEVGRKHDSTKIRIFGPHLTPPFTCVSEKEREHDQITSLQI